MTNITANAIALTVRNATISISWTSMIESYDMIAPWL